MDPLSAITLITEVISSILPWKDILTGYQTYLHYKLRIKEIDAEIESMPYKLEAIKSYLSSKRDVDIKQLETQKQLFEARLPIIKSTLENSFLTQNELRQVMSELRKRLSNTNGIDLKTVTCAIAIIAKQLNSETTNAFNLIGSEVDLQVRNINSIQIHQIQKRLPKF